MRITLLACVTVLCAGVAVAQGSPTPRFQGLGRLPECQESRATAVSGDGSVVVGWCRQSTSIQQAFAWTADGGMVRLEGLAAGHDYANAVSADGSLVVGKTTPWNGGSVAFRWVRDGNTWARFGLNAPPADSEAYGISADGRVIVGYGNDTSQYPTVYEAFRWGDSIGLTFLGDLPGGPTQSYGWGVSGNGAVVVGRSMSTSGDEAFRWTASEGMKGLGDLPTGQFFSEANATSQDGSVVVGYGFTATRQEAFRWTAQTGMVGLGDFVGGGNHSVANALSADGSFIVGHGSIGPDWEAFIWDEREGMRKIKGILVDAGLNLTGWTLAEASGISADGMTVVGWGYDPSGNIEGWVATLPEPATLSLLALGGLALLHRRRGASS
jgi:probable HAF family extracellular repeat protein